jgi:hypothetical protein
MASPAPFSPRFGSPFPSPLSSTSSASSSSAAPGFSADIFENLEMMHGEILEKSLEIERLRAEILAAESGVAPEDEMSAPGERRQDSIDMNQRQREQNARRLAYNEVLARYVRELSDFRQICDEGLKKQLSWSERACLEVALNGAAKLFAHLWEKKSCLFAKTGDNTSMSMTSVVSDIGTGGAKMFSDEQVKGFLSAIGADNERLREEKATLETKNRDLEAELRKEREENARQADELERLQKQQDDVLAAIYRNPEELPTSVGSNFEPIKLPPEGD